MVISKEELTRLPIEVFEGKIVLVDKPEQVKEACEVLAKADVIGFDTETKPSFKKGVSHKVSLLQLSTDDICFLFRLNKIGMPSLVMDILNNPAIKTIGLSLKDDFAALRKIGPFQPANFIEIQALAKKYGIEDKMPILIAEKTGPHFAVGDTCYSWSEDIRVYNPSGKEIVAKDNSVSILRKEDVSKAYVNCHTDITIPYEELEEISVVTKEGKDIILLKNGRFVLPGTEVLNEPLKEEMKCQK